ncbi:MAG TPA: DUF294 nucleotidyltransferase-like domain-containing protein [Thermoanaerobaculia bacterium]|nr:DUF294 nucleotidyltransferase-like domain-containing protein [Thermoanaerobaculia bacterium]
MEPREFLEKQPPFDRLDPPQMRRAEQSIEIAWASRGDAILERTAPPNQTLYVIRKGAVRLERDGQIVQMLEEGDLFGYPSLLGGSSPTVDVFAEEDCLFYQIPKNVFDQLIQVPAFGEYFLEKLAERLRASVETPPTSLIGSLARPVADLIHRQPVFVGPDATVVEAARVMSRERTSSVLVSSAPLGILTDRDLRNRVLANGYDPATPVRDVMSSPVITIPSKMTLFQALVLMLEEKIHHLPIEEDGAIIGVVKDTDLLRHQVKSPLYLLRLLERLEKPEDFPGFASEMMAMVDILYQGDLDALDIGRVVASLHDAATVRLIRAAENELGPPPTPFSWIAFGSGGRMEQALLTDQDNALIYQTESAAAKSYFEKLADRVVGGMVKLGVPRCPGGFMATRWRMSLHEWERQFGDWIRTPDETALIDAANFFDFRPVYGALPVESLQAIIDDAQNRKLFLGRMAKNAVGFRPPLGLFRRIREESEGIDLKKGGIIPVVALGRLYALEHGIRERSTVDRLRIAAGRKDGISREGEELLREAFRFLLHIRLSRQLQARREGSPVTNLVHLDELTPLQRRHLRDAFVAVAEQQNAVSQKYGTTLLS